MKRLLFLIMVAVLAPVSITFVPTPAAAQQQAPAAAQDASKDGVKAATPTTESLSTWELQIIPTQPGYREVTFLMRLRQDGGIVTGDFDCENCPRIVNKEGVAGKAKDGKLYLERASLAFSSFELVITGNEIAGTYVGRGGLRYDVKGKKKEK